MQILSKKSVLLLVVLVCVASAAAWQLGRRNTQTAAFQTARVSRGELLVTINATGTVEPEEVIDVGAQVAGQILTFGKDASGKPVDYGSVVEAGTVLARIDDSLYAADVAQATAQVQSSTAGVTRATADLEQLKAKLFQAERDWQRAQQLGPSEALSQASFDGYQAAYKTAAANVAVGEATIQQASASLAQAEAHLSRSQRNLGLCTIKAPVKGVIIDRRVNIGQTVVASLNAPSLFLIAKDLTRIQVWVAVNEADIGKIKPGLAVSFTVDAFPGETFQGQVGKVRLNAAMTQNVVTYTVEIKTDNANGRLLPYLTANVNFELDHLADALLAPNAALRWTPAADQVAPEFREAYAKAGDKKARRAEAQGPAAKSGHGPGKGAKSPVLWVLEGQYVRPLEERGGQSDGSMTAVEGDGLTEGLAVVTGQQTGGSDKPAAASNPFAPQFPGRSSNSKPQ